MLSYAIFDHIKFGCLNFIGHDPMLLYAIFFRIKFGCCSFSDYNLMLPNTMHTQHIEFWKLGQLNSLDLIDETGQNVAEFIFSVLDFE